MCKAKKIIVQMSVGLVLFVVSTAFGEEPETRKIYFQGEAIELTPRADRLAVRFSENVAPVQKKSILEGKHGITTAAVAESFTNPRIDVVTVQAADIAQVFRDAHKMAQDANIEYATPVFRSYGIDLIPTGELFVQLTAQAGDDAIGAIKRQLNLEEVKRTAWRDGNYLLRTTAQSRDDVFAICEQILERDDVEFSQPNFIRRLKRMDVPNDPLFGSQWGLHNAAQSPPGGNEDCDADAPEGWCIKKGCATVTIAIIDEGCDMTHPDYAAKLVPGFDFTDNNADCTPLSPDAHGTACAGIAAANTDNGLGVAGVNWHASIMPIRIAYGQGGGWVTTDQWLSDGIAWAYQNGADVLSNSWGGGPPSAQIYGAIRDAVIHGRNGKGAVVAFAAGNNNQNQPIFPGRHAETFCVAATSPCDERKSPGSCDGENWGSNYGDALDVAAPGVKIPTTDIQGSAGYDSGDYTMTFNGTSSATPHVAGLASLVMCKYPDYTGLEIQARIEQTCDKVGGYAYSAATGRSFQLGHGRINIYRAMSGKPQVELGPLPDFPSVYRDDGDAKPGYPLTHHDSAACEYLGQDYSPEKNEADVDDPDGKKNIDGPAEYDQDAFEKAVTYYPPYIPGQANKIDVIVTVEDASGNRYAGKNLYVNVWFDWESNDDWNLTYDWVVRNEMVSPSGWGAGVNSKVFTYNFIVPDSDVDWHLQNDNAGQFMHVRTRLTYDQSLNGPAEVADFGEVEDDVFLNFVEMFDIGVGYMNITSGGCEDWLWLDDQSYLNDTCHPPFMPDGPPANGYMAAEVYLDFSGSGFDTGLRTPSFDLTELTEAFVEYDYSAVEPVTGYVYLYKNGVLDATLKVYPMAPLALCNVFHEKIDISAWCGDGNDDIMIEFKTYTPPCDPFEYQDWKLDNIVVWGDDIIDPATKIVNTNPVSLTSNQIDWITPGDDGNIRQAETYNVRYGPKPITAANWKHALWLRKEMVTALPVPQMPGVQENVTVNALSVGLHHFALMTMDEVTNKSGIGPGGANNAPVQTAPNVINVVQGVQITFNVTATDADFDPLLMFATVMPTPACVPATSCMTYVDNGNNTATFTWQTQSGDQGNHVLVVRAKDPNNLTDTDGISINISASPPPTGGCCVGGNCQVVTSAVCNALNGTYQGNGTTCTPNPCTTPATGACCDPNGGCSVVTQPVCFAAGGTYQGDGTICTSTTCSPGSCSGQCPTDLDWSLAATNTPSPRWGHAMAYDSLRDRTVLFGGLNGSETWEWDGASWTQRFPATLPPGRTRAQLAFDSANGVMVLFGGQDATSFFGDTWTWDGSNWQQAFPATSPSPRASFDMVSDTARRRVVLYGGLDAAGINLSDTWEFDGSAWTQVSPLVSPGTLHSHAMTYDSMRRVTVLYGGAPGFGGSDETWEYDGNNWTQRFPATNPGMRNGHKMAYDAHRMVAVLYGGNNFTADTDIWEWDGSDWVGIPKNAPGPRSEHTMAYHASDGEIVLFGGVSGGFNADTWVYPGASVTQAYAIIGTATGIGWSWNVSGPTVDMCDLSVPGAPTGSPAVVLAELFATSIDNAGCGGLSATFVELTPLVALLSVTVGDTSPFDLCVGDFGLMPGCCVAAAGGCSFNPDIFEVHLAGEDCNANGMDDAIDILSGTSQDQDDNGIPDECIPPMDNDLDGDGDVDAADLAMLLGSWGPYAPCPPYIDADFNQDCSVNAADLAGLLGSWGP